MQNVLADAEGAGFFFRDRVLTRVSAVKNVNLSFLANRTEAESLVLLGVDRHRLIVTILPEVERRFEVFVEFYNGVELAAGPAAKSFKRSDLAFGRSFSSS